MRTYSKAVSAAMAAAALTAVTTAFPASAASASVASATAVTIRVERASSEEVPEWRSQFTCPTNQVLTGRTHVGDENSPTTYHCSWIFINDEQVRVNILDWTPGVKESKSTYVAPANWALVGRSHSGDENGLTRYRPATLFWQGRQVSLTGATWTGEYRESNHTTHAPYNQVMTGRLHTGDENGKTQYQYATVTFAG
ncbi:hypothetical protein SAMN05216276_104334 [Streptosporangium subroseum]|uniref:Uncharacterized protein n=1 Tax=Streptosporangium subroseum TaxID=106412 RepID=A0A239MMP2_9ACTN|nr:hypothetical protein [Streptosporangium subroseum]SNT43996.1 hypothetical protein SAMN05216276_104334 [Streptosporangium subroseum]